MIYIMVNLKHNIIYTNLHNNFSNIVFFTSHNLFNPIYPSFTIDPTALANTTGKEVSFFEAVVCHETVRSEGTAKLYKKSSCF